MLVFTAAASSPEQAWKRLAGESSAWVLLANANDDDSLRATRQDLAFVRRLGDVPLVVATYVSMAEDAVAPKQVQKILGLDGKVPVIPCHLRDRESVTGVVSGRARELGGQGRAGPRAPRPPQRPQLVNTAPARQDCWRKRLAASPRKDTTACTTPATA